MPVYQEIIAFLCLVTRYDVKSNHVISQFLIIMLALKYLHCFPIDHVTSFFSAYRILASFLSQTRCQPLLENASQSNTTSLGIKDAVSIEI